MSDLELIERPADGDEIHERLRAAVEVEETSYLWVRGDTPPFIPRLLPMIYGDGRALFTIATINQRPRYWMIRGCSTWGCGLDRENSAGPDFAELTDDLMTALEDAFGRGRCGYSGNSLFHPRKERLRNCQCEECDEKRWKASWPMVDDYGGCSWSRTDWPKEFQTVPNPLSWQGNLLAQVDGARGCSCCGAKGWVRDSYASDQWNAWSPCRRCGGQRIYVSRERAGLAVPFNRKETGT